MDMRIVPPKTKNRGDLRRPKSVAAPAKRTTIASQFNVVPQRVAIMQQPHEIRRVKKDLGLE